MAELHQTVEALSRREHEVAAAYATGASYKEIARDLGISPQTVRTYLGIIYRKLGVRSKIALAGALAGSDQQMLPVAEISDLAQAEASPKIPDKPSIAVLPFENMSGDVDQEYFSDGISDDIITALSRSPWLFVIARSSSFTYRDENVDARRVARELGVRFVLEGGVRHSGGRVRTTARLVDGTSGALAWTERYDGDLADVFDLQDEITRNVVAAIQTTLHLRTMEEPIERRDRPDLTVWELTMRAWKLLYNFKQESYDAAETLLQRALKIDPDSAQVHMLICVKLRHEADMGNVPERRRVMEAAYSHGQRAVALDDTNEYAHWALGLCCWPLGLYDAGVSAQKRALELNPNCSLAHGSLGSALAYVGRSDEAIEHQNIAIRSNPKDPSIFYRFGGIALAHYVAERYEEAIEWADRSIQRRPDWIYSHALRAASLVALNRVAGARDAIDACRANLEDVSLDRVMMFSMKDRAKASEFVERLREAG
ncbi:MAG: LuxR C-terminal-related transcriptional regulator, partial [Pseudomonadota bacterium]